MEARVAVASLLLTTAWAYCGQTALVSCPCRLAQDATYGGISVDCSRRHLTTLPLMDLWIPMATTRLLLNSNSLSHLHSQSFLALKSLPNLRYLNLADNQIRIIDPSAFSCLASLQCLVLRGNGISLDRKFLSGNVFQGLVNLADLDLSGNGNGYTRGRYPDSLFKDLINLEVLSLDTFRGELHFGSLFNTTKRLSSLSLSGGVRKITNSSFEGFEGIRLKKLTISDVHYLRITEPGAFRWLTYLDWYTLSHSNQDMKTTFESFAPFVNRNFREIRLNRLNIEFGITQVNSRNPAIVTRHLARYLSQICIQNFSFTNSYIFFVKTGVFSGRVWRKCLKHIDITGNPFHGEMVEWFRILSQLDMLESIIMTNIKYSFIRDLSTLQWRPDVCLDKASNPLEYQRVKGTLIEHNAESGHRVTAKDVTQTSEATRRLHSDTVKLNQNDKTHNDDNSNVTNMGSVTIHLHKRLKTVVFNGNSYHFFDLKKDVYFVDGEGLEELHVADNGVRAFRRSFHGVVNLKLLDISKNNGSSMASTFLDPLPSLMFLNMRDMKLCASFMAGFSHRLLKHLHSLTSLDLSDNQLLTLAQGTFLTNPRISTLNLAGNRFQSIPFNLEFVPRLCLLDMRRNSLRTVSDVDMGRLEAKARVGSFSLYLDGNEFYCGCESIRFLSWLQRSRIEFDLNGNYSCVLDSGVRTRTGEIKDLEAMWRLCQGRKFFWLTLILTCLMTLVFFIVIVVSKFKLQMKAWILKAIWVPLVQKNAADYPTGVCIVYSDRDIDLACHRLREFIETKLRLSTYVRHRDLLPASDIAEGIVEAIYSSWRVLLVVSHDFPEDPWAYFAMKTATYAVQVENPGRIVLVLVDDCDNNSLLAKVPSCVLYAVREESIISMPSKEHISYENEQALRAALVHPGNGF